MKPIHIVEGNLLCSKSTNLNVNLTQKYPHRDIQNNIWPHIWAPQPTKLTQKINHHNLRQNILGTTVDKKENTLLFITVKFLFYTSFIIIKLWLFFQWVLKTEIASFTCSGSDHNRSRLPLWYSFWGRLHPISLKAWCDRFAFKTQISL